MLPKGQETELVHEGHHDELLYLNSYASIYTLLCTSHPKKLAMSWQVLLIELSHNASFSVHFITKTLPKGNVWQKHRI